MSGHAAEAAFIVQVLAGAWALTAAFRASLKDWAPLAAGFTVAAALWAVAGRWAPMAVCAGLAVLWLVPRLAGWVKR